MRAEGISFWEQKVSKSLIDDGGAAPMELDYIRVKARKVKTRVAMWGIATIATSQWPC